jgi:hypothetical protein
MSAAQESAIPHIINLHEKAKANGDVDKAKADSKASEALTYIQGVLATEGSLDLAKKKEFISQAARLLPLDRTLLREEMIKRLGMKKPKEFDEQVDAARPETADEQSPSESNLGIPDTEPWPDTVNGLSLFDEVDALLRRHVVFQKAGDPHVITAWTVGTYLYEVFNIFPRLGITSPDSQCGKTTVLDILNRLARRPLMTSNLSTSSAFRAVEAWRPTLLVDEMDTFIKDLPELVGVLNSGHKRGGFVIRTEKVGEQFVVTRFQTYGPVVYGMIGEPTGTLHSRSLNVWMLRKEPDEKTEDFNPDDDQALNERLVRLCRQLARWAKDNSERVRTQVVDSGTLSNRTRDNWLPLLKLATVVGGHWPDYIREAAALPVIKPVATKHGLLLRDIRNILFTRKIDRITSAVLVQDLLLQRESGWTRYHNNREPMDERDLAELLWVYRIEPKLHWFNGDQQRQLFDQCEKEWVVENDQKVTKDKRVHLRGYSQEQIEKHFNRFLADSPPEDVEIQGKKF